MGRATRADPVSYFAIMMRWAIFTAGVAYTLFGFGSAYAAYVLAARTPLNLGPAFTATSLVIGLCGVVYVGCALTLTTRKATRR